MQSKSQSQSLPKIRSIEIGHEESAVVQVEGGETEGYLISEAYGVGEPPSEITLRNVIYLCSREGGVEITKATEVLVSNRNDYWFAVETGDVSIIPSPSRVPYPIIFVSKHGYRWMEEMIRQRNFPRLLAHLSERFRPSGFVSSRKPLLDPLSPFCNTPRIRTTPI